MTDICQPFFKNFLKKFSEFASHNHDASAQNNDVAWCYKEAEMKKYTDTYRKNRVPEYGKDAASSGVPAGGAASEKKSGSQYSGNRSMQSLKDCGRTEQTSKKKQSSVKSGADPKMYGKVTDSTDPEKTGQKYDNRYGGSFSDCK